MSGFSDAQQAVAQLLFALPEARGFALAGGSALLALDFIDRPTRDVDAFVGARAGASPGDVRPLLAQLRTALEAEGWVVTIDRELPTFARLLAARGDDAVEVDLAVDAPPLFPLEVVAGLPVLSGPDLAARKVLAILDRAEGRDFTDLRALTARYSSSDCVRWAREIDQGVHPSHIAQSVRKLARLADAELPCDPRDIPDLRSWYERWANELSADEH